MVTSDPEKADNFVDMLANNSKKQKPVRQRPATTSQLSNAVSEEVHHADELLHCFSPEADHFALLFPVLNKHRLCVYDAATGQVVSEHITDDARVTAISWGQLIYNLENSSSQTEKQSPSKKRRKQPDHSMYEVGSPNKDQGIEVIALGLSNGTTELFSPAHGRVVRSLSDPSLRSAITCVRLRSVITADSRISLACVSTNAGEICTWNASQNIPMTKWRHDAHKDLSSFEFNPHDETYLAGSTNISLYSLSKRDLVSGQPVQPEQITHFSGHANRISGLIWEFTKEPRRFVSRSGSDRFLNVWEVPALQTSSREGLIASISMDDNVRHSCLDPNAPPNEQLLFGLTSSGTGALYVLPMARVQSKTTTPARTKIRLISGSEVRFEPISATFIRGREGVLRFAFLVGGIRLLIEEVRFRTSDGHFVEDIVIDKKSVNSNVFRGDQSLLPGAVFKRYQEGSGSTVGSVHDKDFSIHTSMVPELEGVLDVDIAELSLGQRLATANLTTRELSGADQVVGNERETIPLSSLTRTLTQALHSSDSRLLELCLAHSEPATIQSTVELMSPQFALPLLNACVERLGRGHRGTNMKGGGGGASSQRATGLISWVRAVLIVHSGHLMAIPDLASRLSGLHALLTSRLAMHDRLLGLSGRLDLVLTQMELRSSNRPAVVRPIKKDGIRAPRGRGFTTARYLEGESSDEGAQRDQNTPADLESDIEEGSVEDIEFMPVDQLADETEGSAEGSSSGGEESAEDDGTSDSGGNAAPSQRRLANGDVDADADIWSESENESDNSVELT